MLLSITPSKEIHETHPLLKLVYVSDLNLHSGDLIYTGKVVPKNKSSSYKVTTPKAYL